MSVSAFCGSPVLAMVNSNNNNNITLLDFLIFGEKSTNAISLLLCRCVKASMVRQCLGWVISLFWVAWGGFDWFPSICLPLLIVYLNTGLAARTLVELYNNFFF